MCRFKPTVHNVFRLWLGLALAGSAPAEPIISEFLAINERNLADSDGQFTDWIEVHNPDATAANLDGWYLTDNATNKNKWKFPAVTIPARGYLVVFASNKNRRDPGKELHTNFVLEGSGEYLGLVKPDGVTVASEFAPEFPAQSADSSYGVTQPTAAGEAPVQGHFRTPTPRAQNGGASNLLLLERVAFSRASGPFAGTVTLTLSGAQNGQRIRYVVAPPSAAGVALDEPTATSNLYTGAITLAASSLVRAAVFSANDEQRGLATTGHFVRMRDSGTDRVDTFSSRLPLLVIDTHGSGRVLEENGEHPAWVYTWDRASGGDTKLTASPSAASPIATNIRGASSYDFPKKSYTLRLRDTFGRSQPLGLLGLPKFDSWALVGPWTFDRTYIHNAFTYALSNRLGRWAPRTQLVEVFVNLNGGNLDQADYAGIYLLTETLRVDPKRVNITAIDRNDTEGRAITGGYLLKFDVPDSDEFSFRTRRNLPESPAAISIATPKAAEMPTAQRDYIQGYLQALEDALHSDQAGGFGQRTHLDYIDRASWVDHHLLNTLTQNADAFYRSAYLTKDRQGRLVAGPMWDNDRSMHGGDERSANPEIWDGGAGATELWEFGWWGILARDPEFTQAWVDRWQSLRETELTLSNLLALVDSLAGQIGEAAAARDAAKWPDNASRFGGAWQGEINNLKSWLGRRTTWIDTQFTTRPAVTRAGGMLTFTPAPGSQIAYTTDGTDPRAAGGGLSFAARLSSDPVTLPETLDVQVRGYNPDVDRTQNPHSPWSGRVAGPNSSPLSAPVRLANLSSRGVVGSGEDIMIAGVVVNDTAGKRYLARAVGPALASFGVSDALAAPVLTILDSTGRQLARNSGWQSGNSDEISDLTTAVGAFPFARNSRDAALVARLPSGQFTLHVSSANSAAGVALAELYEIDPAIGRTLNLSTRGRVRSGEGLLIGGVVVSGANPQRLLVRAVGPTLALFGVGSPLPDPVLTVFSGSVPLATNDDWSTPVAAGAAAAEVVSATGRVGAFALPAGSKDGALLRTFPPGAYTVQVAGKEGAEGVILLEIYEVP